LQGDEGIYPTTGEKMATLKTVVPGGTVTLAAQTHPADGNAAIVVTSKERADELSADSGVTIRIIAHGQGRHDEKYMPAAPVFAAAQALERAGLGIGDIDCIKAHNPFAVNDIVFSRETGRDVKDMNNYGCSLIWGHPNAATAMRSTVELIEELVTRGGGTGMFQGCAAGDIGMALIVRVEDSR
jgi:acetyl-CoA acetyltransferase